MCLFILEFLNPIIRHYQHLPKILQVVWVTTLFLIIISIIFIFYLQYLRYRLKVEDNLKERLSSVYERNLLQYLFDDEEKKSTKQQKNIIKKLKKDAQDPFKREIIVKSLLKLKQEVSGSTADAIEKLYVKTNLKEVAEQNLKNNPWYAVAKAIKELKLFKIKEVTPKIKLLLSHSVKEVQNEAQLFLVNIFGFEGLDFLNNLTTNLSDWNQIELLEELHEIKNQQLPNITKWLQSKNDDVVSFALKLTKKYNSYEYADELINLISHQSQPIRVAVIQVITHLQIFESKAVFKSKYDYFSEIEQVEIMKYFNEVADDSDVDFIYKNCNHTNFDIQFMASKILKHLNQSKFEKLSITNGNVKVYNYIKSKN
ncbi:MAG: hypothetical protein ACWA42_06735 [Lutibacter sp.]